MKVRPNRIGEEIKKELVQLIRNGVKDPRVDSLISITDVEVTRDLSYATVLRHKAHADAFAADLFWIFPYNVFPSVNDLATAYFLQPCNGLT